MDQPLVSIGVPVFNGENYLKQALDSLFAQSYPNLEIIISDNASTDGTEAIARQARDQDGRVKYFQHPENLGAARNFNFTFEQSSGRFFKWAAHDDLLQPAFIEECQRTLESRPDAVVCYPRTILIDEDGQEIRQFEDGFDLQADFPAQRLQTFLVRMHKAQLVNPVFGLIRRAALQKSGLIRPMESSDVVLMAELALQGKFIELPQHLFLRREHAGRSSRATASGAERQAWFAPQEKSGQEFGRWRVVSELFTVAGKFRSASYRRTRGRLAVWAWIWLNLPYLVWELIRPIDKILGFPLKRGVLALRKRIVNL